MLIILLQYLLLSQPQMSVAQPCTLQNSHLLAVVTPVTAGVRAGSLTHLIDLQTGADLADGRQFGGVQSGPYIPVDGSIVLLSDSEAVFSSAMLRDLQTQEVLPVAITIHWTLVGRGVEYSVSIHATGEAELWDPLETDFYCSPYNQARFTNQTIEDDWIAGIHASDALYRISGDQVVSLVGGSAPPSTWTFPNPAKNNLVVTCSAQPGADSYLTIRMYDVEAPRENCQGPDLHSILPAGETGEWYARLVLGDSPATAFISGHPDGYERTSAWIMDEIPFIHPDQGYMWQYSTTGTGPEEVSAQMIALLEAHPDMKMNWLILPDGILTPNRDSVWAEPGYEESWSHWHGTWRISTEAPADYRQWLLNIEDHVYPWADRVELGCHGYHHTPNADSSFGEFHEFITYEPEEHLERFRMSMLDLDAMGLDTTLIRTIRYPGHRTSLSGLYATITHGFDFYCNGIRWYQWMGGYPFWDQYLSMYRTPEGRIWGSNTVWWGDYQSEYPVEYLSTVLTRGKHALIGAHPFSLLDPGIYPVPYNRADSICTSMEQDYPHFGWLLPSEYGDFLAECWEMSITSTGYFDDGMAITFTGSTSCGQTIVMRLTDELIPQQVTVDGTTVGWEMREGNRLFIGVNGLGSGLHEVRAYWLNTGISDGVTPDSTVPMLHAANPSGWMPIIAGEGFPTGTCTLSVYDLSGRRVAGETVQIDGSGAFSTSLDLSEGVSTTGLHFVVAESDGVRVSRSLMLLLH
jgi:hypothetical protein